MELHPLLSCRREAQAITWQGYGEVADLQIPKFELLFRFCVNIYYFKNHYRTENNQILLLSVTVTRCHGVAVSNTTVNHVPLSSQCWPLLVRDTWTTHRLQWYTHPSTPDQEMTAPCTPVVSATSSGKPLNTRWKSPNCCDGRGTGLRPGRNAFKQKSSNLKCFSFLDTMTDWKQHPQKGRWEMRPYQMLVEQRSPLQALGPSPLMGLMLLLARSVPGELITVRSRHFNLEKEKYTRTTFTINHGAW